MSQVTITKKPNVPVINLAQNGGGNYVFNHFLGTYDFRIQYLDVKPPADSKGGSFTLRLVANDATNASANTILSNISNGNEVVIYVGKSDAGKTLVFRGVIESIEIQEPQWNQMIITLTGPDFGSNILKHRIIQGYWEQKKDVDGITLINDANTYPTQIVQDMLSISGKYPTSDGITAAAQGIVVNSANIVALNNTSLAQYTALVEILDDKISEIDAIAQTIHFVDPNKNFIMKPPTLSTTQYPATSLVCDDYNDTIALTWDQTKLSLISPGGKFKKTVENYKHRLYGIGGDQVGLDQKFETNTTSQNIDANWYAVQFTPLQYHCYAIGIYVKAIGIPLVDLTIILVEDSGGSPTGLAIRTTSIPKENISASFGWAYTQLDVNLNTAKKYWIVLPSRGIATKTYSWGKDAGAANTNASSADGITWTVNTNSFGFNFREYYSAALVKPYPTNVAASDKMFRELAIRRPNILTRQTMDAFLIAQSATFFKEKWIYTATIYNPDTIFSVGQVVRLRKGQSSPNGSGFAVDQNFVVSGLNYIFESVDTKATGSFYMEVELTTFVNYP